MMMLYLLRTTAQGEGTWLLIKTRLVRFQGAEQIQQTRISSVWLERLFWEQEAEGSNPSFETKNIGAVV